MTNVRKVTVIRRKVNPDPLGYPAWAAIVNLSTGDNTWTYWNTWPEALAFAIDIADAARAKSHADL